MDEVAVCVHVAHRETKIGDTLCTLPLIRALADMFEADIHVTGAFADSVKPLLRAWPIRFGRPADRVAVAFGVDIQAAYDEGARRNEHMARAICRLADFPAPDLPASLDLAAAAAGLPPGFVLSPFSGSQNPGYKAWPVDRWSSLVRHLAASRPEPIYVIGAAGEAFAPFGDAGATPLADLPLPAVLRLMRDAVLFVSIDNGASHLAHFGAVERHLLLYPALLPPALVVNPRARVLRGQPHRIDVGSVISGIEDMLRPAPGLRSQSDRDELAALNVTRAAARPACAPAGRSRTTTASRLRSRAAR